MKYIWKTHTLHFFFLATNPACSGLQLMSGLSLMELWSFTDSLILICPPVLGTVGNSSKRLDYCHRIFLVCFVVTVNDIQKDPKSDGYKGILKFNLSKRNVSVGGMFWLEVDENLSDNCYYLFIPTDELPWDLKAIEKQRPRSFSKALGIWLFL